ncbi:MAG: hypothetical protein H0T13_08535 [Actinobacteria bacterium]|nr:hypothetical protein [Actinomycetota bacterium]
MPPSKPAVNTAAAASDDTLRAPLLKSTWWIWPRLALHFTTAVVTAAEASRELQKRGPCTVCWVWRRSVCGVASGTRGSAER